MKSFSRSGRRLMSYVKALGLASVFVTASLHHAAQAEPFAYVADAKSNNISVIDTSTNTVTGTIALPSPPNGIDPRSITVTPDGKRIYAASGGGISVIDAATSKVTATIPGGQVELAGAPDGKHVYANGYAPPGFPPGFAVSVIDTRTNAVKATVTLIAWPYGTELGTGPIAVAPDGRRVYAFAGYVQGMNLYLIDASAGKVTATVAFSGYSTGLAVAPDGKHVYVTTFDAFSFPNAGVVSVIDTSTNKITATVAVGNGSSSPVVTPDGKQVYVANNGSNTVSVIDASANKVTATIAVGASPGGVAITPDGKHVYVTNRGSNTVSVIDTVSNEVTATIPAKNPGVIAIQPPPLPIPFDTATQSVTRNFFQNRAYGNGDYELVVREGSALRHYWFSYGGDWRWHKAASFGSNVQSAPAMFQNANNDYELAVREGNALHHYWFYYGGDWQWHAGAMFGWNIQSAPGMFQAARDVPGLGLTTDYALVARQQGGSLGYFRLATGDSGGDWQWRPASQFGLGAQGAPQFLEDHITPYGYHVVVKEGLQLRHYWSQGQGWNLGALFGGNVQAHPVMLQNARTGNFDLVVQESGRLQHYWYDRQARQWNKGLAFAANVGSPPAMVQNQGDGAYDIVAQEGAGLRHYRLSWDGLKWNVSPGQAFGWSVASSPSMFQNRNSNIELVVRQGAELRHYWYDVGDRLWHMGAAL